MAETYRIGSLVLDAESCVLTDGGVPLPLGKRAVAVLAVLVRSAPRYVSKTRILETAWPGMVVEEGNLAVQISSIRRALTRVAGSEAWLETLPRRGYRFVGPVTRLPQSPSSDDYDRAPQSNLPQQLTSFVGRERELADVARLLSSHRLVTLTGTGGVGKTRLALRIAATTLTCYADGAWLVELAPLDDADLVPQAAIAALGVKEQPGRTLTQTLIQHLQDKRLLLLLDNAEHLLAACAGLVDNVLRQCPKVVFLVTSRERLGVPGEATYRVPSLSLPAPSRAAGLDDFMDSESVRLFAERARLHITDFAITKENRAGIADICRRLDGIALAIELAAARMRSMSVDELNQRLDDRFHVLTGGSRILPARQQTLRAAIDWSFELLGDTERMVFCAVSVFVGGFTAEAAEHVTAGDKLQSHDVLDVLTSLADKSLLIVEQRGSATRYRLLETVRQYATEQSRALFRDGPWLRRHLEYFCALAAAAEPQLTGSDQQAWLDRLEIEHDNLRGALARSMTSFADAQAGLTLASALARFWLVRGYLAEGRGWFARLLAAAPDAKTATRAKALNWTGILAWKQGDYSAAKAAYEQSLAIRKALGDRKGVGAVLNNQGLLAYEQGDYRAARTLHDESLAIDRELGDRWGVAVSLIHLAGLATVQGDYPTARALNEESLDIFRSFGDVGHIASAMRNLGNVHSEQGNHAAARALYDESLGMCKQLGDRSGIAGALCGLGVTARHAGDASVARALLQQSLAIYRDLGDREGTAKVLNNLGLVAAAQGDLVSAHAFQLESLAIYKDLREQAGIAAAIEGLAATEIALGRAERAVCLCAAMERLREDLAAPMASSERPGYDRMIGRAHAAFRDAASFERAWRQGHAMTPQEAVAYALEGRES